MGIVLMAEGGLMGLCLVPALHFADGTALQIAACAALTIVMGFFLWYRYRRDTLIEDRRMSYLLVVLLWLVLSLFATLPFLATGSTLSFTTAWFEAMSGVTSTGATIFPHVRLLGASGIVFAFILLSSITVREQGTIPLTFLLVALMYIGQQVYEGIFLSDNVSQITHIAGGAVGSCLGFFMNRRGFKRK